MSNTTPNTVQQNTDTASLSCRIRSPRYVTSSEETEHLLTKTERKTATKARSVTVHTHLLLM